MTNKQSLLLGVAVLICGSLFYFNRDWFSKPPIQISHRFDAFGGRFAQAPGAVSLFFEFNRPLKLNSVEVYPLSELQTNRAAKPLWQLLSDSNSLPTKGFLYGAIVPGMRAASPADPPAAPEPAVTYRLQIKAGALKAHYDFVLELPQP